MARERDSLHKQTIPGVKIIREGSGITGRNQSLADDHTFLTEADFEAGEKLATDESETVGDSRRLSESFDSSVSNSCRNRRVERSPRSDLPSRRHSRESFVEIGQSLSRPITALSLSLSRCHPIRLFPLSENPSLWSPSKRCHQRNQKVAEWEDSVCSLYKVHRKRTGSSREILQC